MFGEEFYPTPRNLIDRMLECVDFNLTENILEPSAGKGDICDAIVNKDKARNYHSSIKDKIDTIEIDENLQHILRGKEYKVVHNDFLTFHTYKRYHLIIMNPPFSNGDKHLLKAIEMQEEHGGQVVCLLNAETIDNPYTNTRKDLLNRLERHDADVQYIDDAFTDAERKTKVRVALISLKIEKPELDSIILDDLRQSERYEEEIPYSSNSQVIDADFIKGIVEQYSFEVRAGLKLISEWRALKPLILNSFKDEYSKPILKLEVDGSNKYDGADMENRYIEELRMKYWKELFASEKFMGRFTSNLRGKYYNRVQELKDYDFSLWNIYTIRIQLAQEMVKAIEQTILDLFDEFSHRHYWDEDMNSGNIHYYSGWKTNKAWCVNSKVITMINAFCSYSGRFEPQYNCGAGGEIADIEKVFSYLDGGKTMGADSFHILNIASQRGQTRKIELKYFYATFYKKGTCHIQFKNDDLLHKFNLFGSQRKGWLPPSYGKAKYADMTQEEQAVVDSFEGRESYDKVMDNKEYYIVDSEQLLALTC